jgi:hypothetical protein
LACSLAAEAVAVYSFYQVPNFNNFGSVVGTPLVSNFGNSTNIKGTLTSTVYRAAANVNLDGDQYYDILVNDLTFAYTLTNVAGYTLDWLQVHLLKTISDARLALDGPAQVLVGYTTTSYKPLLQFVTEADQTAYQLEFGAQSSGPPDYRLRLGGTQVQTMTVFVTFRHVDLADTNPTALVKGAAAGKIPTTSGILALGPEPMPEPAAVTLLAVGGIGVVIGAIRRRR